MDHSIREPVLADVAGWLADHASVRLVAVNGRSAERFLKRALRSRTVSPSVQIVVLPSTSPAYAAMPIGEKVRRWGVLREFALSAVTQS